MRFLIFHWPWDGFRGHTYLVAHWVPYWVRLADLFKLLISSRVNFQIEAMSYDLQTETDSYWYKVDGNMWDLIVVP